MWLLVQRAPTYKAPMWFFTRPTHAYIPQNTEAQPRPKAGSLGTHKTHRWFDAPDLAWLPGVRQKFFSNFVAKTLIVDIAGLATILKPSYV